MKGFEFSIKIRVNSEGIIKVLFDKTLEIIDDIGGRHGIEDIEIIDWRLEK